MRKALLGLGFVFGLLLGSNSFSLANTEEVCTACKAAEKICQEDLGDKTCKANQAGGCIQCKNVVSQVVGVWEQDSDGTVWSKKKNPNRKVK